MEYPDFYTKEMIEISNKNNYLTRQLLNVPDGYHMHHKDVSLRYNDPERYIQWLPEDLEIMNSQEHRAFHSRQAGLASAEKSRGTHHTKEQNMVTSRTTKEAMHRTDVRAKYLAAMGAHPVRCIETGEEFACAADAIKKYGKRHIIDACTGARKKCAGYHWEFI